MPRVCLNMDTWTFVVNVALHLLQRHSLESFTTASSHSPNSSLPLVEHSRLFPEKMIATEEPIICKLDRLDNILRQLEEIRGCGRSSKSSYASTPSSGFNSDEQNSSADLSPNSLEKHRCRPIADVRAETQVKGSLMERLVQVEVRLHKVEEELEQEKKRQEGAQSKAHKSGLRKFVNSCVKGDM